MAGGEIKNDRIGKGGTYSFETRTTSASSPWKRSETFGAAGGLEAMTVGARDEIQVLTIWSSYFVVPSCPSPSAANPPLSCCKALDEAAQLLE